MIHSRAVLRHAGLLLLSCCLAGCLPSSRGNLDEQKDPHYLNGRGRVSSLDYKGAIEEFEKALDANPLSASAHLELALLYEEQMKDFAAAIYHYERHLKLRSNSEYAERAKERIKSCKMDLVKNEVLGPVNQGMQRELERLTTENMLLKQRVETLEAHLAGQAVRTSPPPSPAVPVAVPTSTRPEVVQRSSPPEPDTPEREPVVIPVTTSRREPPPAARSQTRTYKVKAGDKLTTIAKNYGVELSRLMEANPGVNPARLQIGQTLNIP